MKTSTIYGVGVQGPTVIRHCLEAWIAPKNALKVFKRARALLRKGWMQGNYATDIYGCTVSVHSAQAASFCASGAIFHAAGGITGGRGMVFSVLFQRLSDVPANLPTFNDHKGRTQLEVLGLFSRVIMRLEQAIREEKWRHRQI